MTEFNSHEYRLRRSISLMTDLELHQAITKDRHCYYPAALAAFEEEYRNRGVKESKLRKIRAYFLSSSDLHAKGYRTVPDRLAGLHAVTGALFVSFSVLYASLAFLDDIPVGYHKPLVLTVILLGCMYFVLIRFFMHSRRRCPRCRAAMAKLIPLKEVSTMTYKYYCSACQVYIDTGEPVNGKWQLPL